MSKRVVILGGGFGGLYAAKTLAGTDVDEQSAGLTFGVVGAGRAGVELAGALGEIANDTLAGDFRHVDPAQSQILLVDNSPRVLSGMPPDLSEAAEKSLIRLGVRTI